MEMDEQGKVLRIILQHKAIDKVNSSENMN
jgi:hypothetical protein